MSAPFELVREKLLRAGVAPAHVRRYMRELSEHYLDLKNEELAAGRSSDEAEAAARARLGGDEALAEAMLAQPALRSWTARAPWATLVVGPFLLLVLAWFVPVLLVVFVMWPKFAPRRMSLPPVWLPPVDEALFNLAQFGAPVLVACGVALIAARQRSRPIWPIVGCAVVTAFGDSLHWAVHWPTPSAHDPRAHDLSLGLAFRGAEGLFPRGGRFSLADWSHGLPLIALSLAVAAVVYWLARRRALAPA